MDTSTGDSAGEISETRRELIEATRDAMCKHGFADLTMQAIADESEKSKAALHYHFDTKEELLAETLSYLLAEFIEEVDTGPEGDPEARLRALTEAQLFGPNGRDGDSGGHWEYHAMLLEIQSHAPHNETFKEQFTANYEYVRQLYADIIEDGIEQGVFEPVDANRTAVHIMAAIKGARVNHVTTEREDIAETVHDALLERVLEPLRA
ncbi:TetR/AcrR family transcriptional regulator [Halapricum hydrolyticum]|uniref:TetR/AcrR family transcriptional regulator n=1 Tax=Halapricum hydrolyticum TaxID=2979991 RepID=A0AAE3LG28_9EURY|nr:TetR/AcrR family transcriptional regulator [Halapricum hydrolyticum]MCU4719264.1 TetR/AcrR family transcriptional regulator [Halapricum hydrolyticum]MCU4728551.1 TetR/AcrR family transcriptional regulator [Halapricum hydrolyticum]